LFFNRDTKALAMALAAFAAATHFTLAGGVTPGSPVGGSSRA